MERHVLMDAKESVGGTIGGVNSDEWTLAFTASPVSAIASGTAANAIIERSAANGSGAHLTGLTVGTSGSDINLDNTNIASGQNISLSSAVIKHAT